MKPRGTAKDEASWFQYREKQQRLRTIFLSDDTKVWRKFSLYFFDECCKVCFSYIICLCLNFLWSSFCKTGMQNIIADRELLDRLPTMKNVEFVAERTILPAWWLKLHIKVNEIYSHWPSGWNRNRVFTIHVCWIGRWISRTFQCAVYQNATFWRNSSSRTCYNCLYISFNNAKKYSYFMC